MGSKNIRLSIKLLNIILSKKMNQNILIKTFDEKKKIFFSGQIITCMWFFIRIIQRTEPNNFLVLVFTSLCACFLKYHGT